MKRRDFITVLAGAVTHPRWAGAQQRSQLPLVGIFGGSVRLEYDAFLQEMRGLGYVEGRNISYAQRLQAGGSESAQELIGLKPELIVCPGGVRAPRLLMEATSTIPIVMVTASDVVENGLVISLARPGGNVTGLSYQSNDLSTKRLQLLHETLPLVRRIAMFIEPGRSQSERDGMAAAGRTLGLELGFVEISAPDTFDAAFETAANRSAEALSVATGFVTQNKEKFLALAARYRLPSVYHQSIIVHAGGLMSYGPNFPDLWRRAATYVDKILKGAKPADLPVEQPTRFEFVINLKTAKELGVTIPESIRARADEVIE